MGALRIAVVEGGLRRCCRCEQSYSLFPGGSLRKGHPESGGGDSCSPSSPALSVTGAAGLWGCVCAGGV